MSLELTRFVFRTHRARTSGNRLSRSGSVPQPQRFRRLIPGLAHWLTRSDDGGVTHTFLAAYLHSSATLHSSGDGRRVVFSLLVNDYHCPAWKVQDAVDQLVLALIQGVPRASDTEELGREVARQFEGAGSGTREQGGGR